MVFRSGPLTFTPIGARMPLWSMTMRAAMGWSFGAPVVPGIWAAFTISFQMSSGDLISSRHWRYGRPCGSAISSPFASRTNWPVFSSYLNVMRRPALSVMYSGL